MNVTLNSVCFSWWRKEIGNYKVDGFCQELNTVFEFYGNYWHCHPDQFPDENAIHPTVKDKNGNPMIVKDIHARDHQRIQDLQDQGCNVEIIWEKDWQALLTQRPDIKSYLSRHRTFTHFKKYLTQDQIIQYIRDGHLFGFVECDTEVPDHLKEYFSEMTPILKNVDVCLDDVAEFMQEYAKQHNIKDVPRRLLIGSYFGKKIGLTTPLLKCYLEHGLVITRIYTTVEYIRNAAFSSFMTQIAQCHLEGDRDKDKALIAEMSKLIGNSSFGRMITNKEKHHDIVYIDESKISTEIIDNHFYDMTELPDGYYEVEKTKKKINLDFPIHIGVFILNYAKLRMLEFYYDFLDHYLSREDFEYSEMDTDSAYMAISGDSFEELIKPDLRKEFEIDKHNWFVTPLAPQGKHTPGLFKVEFKGDKIIGLCSKSYCTESFATDSTPGQVKFSMKGVNKGQFKNPMSHYEHVLHV